MSLWQFLAMRDGYILANCPPEGPKPPSEQDFENIVAEWGDF